MAEMRVLTIRQPWAHFVAHCGKQVENRPWPVPRTLAPGTLLAVHAGAYSGWDREAESDTAALEGWKRYARTRDGRLAIPLTRGDAFSYFAFGAVIAVASVAGFHDWRDCTDPAAPGMRLCSPWARAGQWHWELADVRPVARPVPCRGRLGLWRLPADAEKAVREQIAQDPRGKRSR